MKRDWSADPNFIEYSLVSQIATALLGVTFFLLRRLWPNWDAVHSPAYIPVERENPHRR